MDITREIEALDKGNLISWEGLNDSWTRDAIARRTDTDLKCTGHTLANVRYQKCLFPLKNQPQPLQCFFDAAGQCQLLRLEDAQLLLTAKELAEKIGEPDTVRTLPRNSLYAPAAQWIYSEKGLTLYVLQPEKKGSLAISAFALYAPTTAEHYLQKLGGDETIDFSDY